MQALNWLPMMWLALATILEIVANIFLKYSNGFHKPIFGILSLAAVLTAFGALSQAVKGINLSVAYALWGGFGIIATAAADFFLFHRKFSFKGWLGIALLLLGMMLIKFS